MKTRTVYTCQQCGGQSPKFAGRCTECGAWNSYVETLITPTASKSSRGAASVTAPPLLKDVQSSAGQRIPTGLGEMDRVMGGGIVPGSITLLGGEPGIGKCVTGDTRILDPETGEYLPITEWQPQRRSVVGLDADYTLAAQPVNAFLDQGVQHIVEVKTRLGRTLRCTPSHPVLTADGWQAIGELPIGTQIASPRALPYFGQTSMPDAVVKLIAYILSDGSAQSDVSVTTMLPEVVADLTGIAQYFGMALREYTKPLNRASNYRFVLPLGVRAAARREIATVLRCVQKEAGITWVEWARLANIRESSLRGWNKMIGVPSKDELQRLAQAVHVSPDRLAGDAYDLANKTTPVARILQDVGLRYSTAETKAVPRVMFGLPREQIALFLKTLFTCDGSVYVTQNRIPGVSYSTISHQLAQDIQHLLLRFGFITRLRTKPMLVNQAPYTAYELQMLGVQEVRRFIDQISIWGREEAKAKIAQMAQPSVPSTHFDTIPTGAAFWEHVHEVSADASFKALSRSSGVTIHSGRYERPLSRSTVQALAVAYPSDRLEMLANGDIYWDEIASITPAGEARVFDIAVPDCANFVANDLIVHNSTLMAQIAAITGTADQPALYVSAEESPQQIKLRADRLGISGETLYLLAETDAETISETARNVQPRLMIVDSIQTIALASLASAPGSISQVRECTVHLMRLAKETQIPVLLIGHVTKDGTVAGPRALEHIVDAVLYLEGERFHSYRLLRSVKNRFGATDVGIFEMRGEGMVEVADPSGIFLADRSHRATGSAVTISLEGTRPLLVEIQALASATSYGTPSRTVTGVDHTRLLMLLAVLAKRAGIRLGQHDVYVNVVGGLELAEPAIDLGIAAAIASSLKEQQIGGNLALVGEVGLGGELRAVARLEMRVREAARLGFRRCVIPKASQAQAGNIPGIEIVPVGSLAEAIDAALDARRYDEEVQKAFKG